MSDSFLPRLEGRRNCGRVGGRTIGHAFSTVPKWHPLSTGQRKSLKRHAREQPAATGHARASLACSDRKGGAHPLVLRVYASLTASEQCSATLLLDTLGYGDGPAPVAAAATAAKRAATSQQTSREKEGTNSPQSSHD